MKTINNDFIMHLSRSQDLVRSWPDWKKNMWPDESKYADEPKHTDELKNTKKKVSLLSVLTEIHR